MPGGGRAGRDRRGSAPGWPGSWYGAAQDALRVIESTSRGALTETRRQLDILRQDTEHATELTQPGIAGPHDLAEHASAAGVRAELTVTGEGHLPEALQLTLYRIAQGALTNVVKQAVPTRCRVTLTTESGQVSVQVVNDGPARSVQQPGPGGHGLIGMRERVARYGGTFSAQTRPEGGFTVTATLPRDRKAGRR